MCHFHSVIVDGQGRIYHLPENSHSAIAEHFKLDNTDLSSPFWECEWDGIGEQPVQLCQNRGFGKPEPTALAVSAADRHYAKLASFLKGDNDASSLFLTADYSDVPAMVEHTQRETVRRAEREAFLAKQRAERESAEALGQSIFASVGAAVEALSDEGMILAVRAFIQELSVSLEDVAADEIESATESATENMVSLDDGDYAYIGDGDYIYHSDALQYCIDNNELDDYYTDEQVEERIDEAKTEWKREVMEALENVG